MAMEETSIEQERAMLSRINEMIKEKDAACKIMENKLEAKEVEARNLLRQIQVMENSLSWKLTRPLRKLDGLIKDGSCKTGRICARLLNSIHNVRLKISGSNDRLPGLGGATKDRVFFSHIGQDYFVSEVFKSADHCFFVDVGAFDGMTISNTYALEKSFGWKGLCIEANPKYYKQLCDCRDCQTCNKAVWNKAGEELPFIDIHGLSALKQFTDSDSMGQIRREGTEIVVTTATLDALLNEYHVPACIDYMSIDVEGSEIEALEPLDFSKQQVCLITIEHNHNEDKRGQIFRRLKGEGFDRISVANEDWYYHLGHLSKRLGRDAAGVKALISRAQRAVATYEPPEVAEPGT